MSLQISLRDSILEDAVPIFELRCDPCLASMQYPPSYLETPATLLAAVQPGPEIPTSGYKCSTILVEEKFAGHISRMYRTREDGVTDAFLGWNLIPELWGKGIMVRSLGLLFDSQYESKKQLEFVACCFASNHRCIRVIQKLGFQPARLTVSERLSHFIRTWGKQTIQKYRLTHHMWHQPVARGSRHLT